jgi:quinoprotein glucose dehydrogenase
MKSASILLIIFMVFAGFGFINIGELSEKSTLKVSGEELFQKNCAACHGINLQGNPPAFPSLVDIDKRMEVGQVGELLKTGRNAMPSFAHITESERNAIAGFLFGELTETDVVTELSSVENGNNLFVANCVQCHQAKPDDPPPKGRRNWGMQPAILGGINTKYSQDEFQRILNAGPCYMPSFDFLNQDDKSDIYTYLGSMEGFYANSKYMRSKGCRGRMKCRSW